MKNLIITVFLLFFAGRLIQAQWIQTGGPCGGDVRCIASDGSNMFAGTSGTGLYLSTDNGSNWTAVNAGLTNLYVHSLAISGSNTFAGTHGGVFLSTDNGSNWTAVNTGLTNLYVYSLAISGSNIFAGTYGGGVFLSTDNGSNWTAVNTGLTNIDVHSLAISGSNIFAGTSGGGVFLSTNNGSNWTAVNTGLTNTEVYSLAVSGSIMFAGTQSKGVWSRPLSQMVDVKDDNNLLPNKFTLEQNYPNPFNPSTVIRYQLSATGKVSLRIYNALGQEVRTLIDQNETAGSKFVIWDGKDNQGKRVSDGVYIYCLQAGKLKQAKKCLLLK